MHRSTSPGSFPVHRTPLHLCQQLRQLGVLPQRIHPSPLARAREVVDVDADVDARRDAVDATIMPPVQSPYAAGARNPHRRRALGAPATRDRLAGGMQARSRTSPPARHDINTSTPASAADQLKFVPTNPLLDTHKRRKTSAAPSLPRSKKTLDFSMTDLVIRRVLVWPPPGEKSTGQMTCLSSHKLLICLPPLRPSESWTIRPEDIAAIEMVRTPLLP